MKQYPFQTLHIKSCIFDFLLVTNFLVECWRDTDQRVEKIQAECLKEIIITYYLA